jgi:hypothetical protein
VKTGKVSILRIDGPAVLHSERGKMRIRREVNTTLIGAPTQDRTSLMATSKV